MSKIEALAIDLFEKKERVKMLEMTNTPVEYEARKRAFVDLVQARYEVA